MKVFIVQNDALHHDSSYHDIVGAFESYEMAKACVESEMTDFIHGIDRGEFPEFQNYEINGTSIEAGDYYECWSITHYNVNKDTNLKHFEALKLYYDQFKMKLPENIDYQVTKDDFGTTYYSFGDGNDFVIWNQEEAETELRVINKGRWTDIQDEFYDLDWVFQYVDADALINDMCAETTLTDFNYTDIYYDHSFYYIREV